MKKNNNSNYKGKYYDPNYHQNKRKYGDAYDPKQFAKLNPNWESTNRQKAKQSKQKSNNRGKNYYSNWQNYSVSERKAIKEKRAKQQLILLVSILVIGTLGYLIQEFSGFNATAAIEPINTTQSVTTESSEIGPDVESLMANQEISVSACDLVGERQPNVKVDVGYGDRLYYGYTNEHSQLVYGYADSVQLQDESNESVINGRYCEDEAAVSGTEDPNLDQGHVFGDALGGVGNAYNITPQDSSVNQQLINDLEQEMQEVLYNGGSVTNFETKIYYPNKSTQTPSRYELSYAINGEVRDYSFDN